MDLLYLNTIFSFGRVILLYSKSLLNTGRDQYKQAIKTQLSPTGDLERISPYTISIISSRQVMRIKKNIN